jgi:hypothetical protein
MYWLIWFKLKLTCQFIINHAINVKENYLNHQEALFVGDARDNAGISRLS